MFLFLLRGYLAYFCCDIHFIGILGTPTGSGKSWVGRKMSVNGVHT